MHVDKNNYQEARNEVQKLCLYKEKILIQRKHSENIGKSKELWKNLESLGLKFENSFSHIS